jgi:hypothetical protein
MATKSRSRIAPLLSALAALLAAGPASANGYLSAQVGGFVPWQGDAGVMTSFQLLGSGASGRSRWGGEFEYRDFDTKIQGVRDVGVSSYVLHAMWQYHFRPEAVVTPYIGLGLGLVIDSVDDNKVNNALGDNARDQIGVGLDGVFLFGVSVNIPGADYMSVFAEGRAGLAFDASDGGNNVEVEDVGGASGSAGLRFRF